MKNIIKVESLIKREMPHYNSVDDLCVCKEVFTCSATLFKLGFCNFLYAYFVSSYCTAQHNVQETKFNVEQAKGCSNMDWYHTNSSGFLEKLLQ